jgi:putative aldouronate transport system permease protein
MSPARARPTNPGGRRDLVRKMLGCWQLYVLLAPALVYFIVLNYVPMYGAVIAFKDFTPGQGILGSPWVGLRHFVTFLTSYQCWMLIRNTVVLSVYSIVLGFPLPILLALMLNEMRTGFYKKFIQTVSYAPHFISMVVMVSMLILFLSPSSGIVNAFLGFFGVEPVNFMGKENLFPTIYVLSSAWQETGWASILYLAALTGIDPELHEAARMDGASRAQRIWHVNLPGILPTIIVVLIFTMSGIMNVGFEKAYLMQNAMNLTRSEIIATYVYKRGIENAQYSFSTAVGLFNSMINFTILLGVNRIARRVSGTSLW